MRLILTAAVLGISTQVFAEEPLTYSGRANSWFLYQTDDVASTTVAIVKSTANGSVLGIAVGRDIAIECAKSGVICEYRTLESAGEFDLDTTLGRTTGAIGTLTTEDKGKIGGDSLLWNLGTDTKLQKGQWYGRINGNLTTSLLDQRTLYGNDRVRFRFSDLYAEYNPGNYRARLGRQHVIGGTLVDGLSADYFLGPDSAKDSFTAGGFAGAAPDPISKFPTKDFLTFGPKFQWIPRFSAQSDTKFFLEGAVVSELYKGSMDRFYLYSKAHFSPTPMMSMLMYTNIELPWSGDDGDFAFSMFVFNTTFRPSKLWFISIQFSEFRIDRHLQEEGVRWVTDGTAQTTRVSETLDRSQRYRGDFRLSYRPIPEFQPYFRGRYERRTIDTNKDTLNTAANATPVINASLLNQKNAYSGTFGFRLFLLDRLETDTSGTYGQRYQSRIYNFFQSASWDSGKDWTVDGFGQYVWSRRSVDPSLSTGTAVRERTVDYYVGAGGSYRFRSNLLGQLRYDFGSEDDKSLDTRISIHTVWLRFDYNF